MRSPSIQPNRAPATLRLTTPHKAERSKRTNDVLAPRSCWAQFSYLQPSRPLGQFLISSKTWPCFLDKTWPCTTTFPVWSIGFSMAIPSHNSAVLLGYLPSADSGSRESTIVPVAAQNRLPGHQNSILPGFPPILTLALRSRIG